MLKNVAGQDIGAQMLTAADGTAFTGTVTVYVTIESGTQTLGTVGSGVCTHEGNGYHSYLPSQAETNGDHIAYTFIGTLAAPVTLQIYTDATYDRVGAPAGASIAADLVVIDNFVDGLETTIGVLGAGLTDLGGMSTGMKAEVQTEADASLAAIHLDHLLAVAYNSASPEGVPTSLLNEMTENNAGTTRFTAATLATGPGGTPSQPLLQSTTISGAPTSNTQFILAAGSADDDAYNNQMIVVTDVATGTQKAVGLISDYTGSTREVFLDADPLPTFTFADTDIVEIWAVTGSPVALEVDANGRVDVGNVAGTSQTPGDLAGLTTAVQSTANTIEADLTNGTDGLSALSADIAIAQADLNIITGVDGVNLLTATQASIDAIELDTGTTLDGKLDTIDTEVGAIQTDLDNATDGLGALKADLASIITGTITNATGIDVATDVVALKAVADAIQTITDQFNFTVAGDVDSNVQAVANAAISEGGSDPASPIGQT